MYLSCHSNTIKFYGYFKKYLAPFPFVMMADNLISAIR